jgi:hypothetical protein
MNVAFTGPAFTPNGVTVKRADLMTAILAFNQLVEDKITVVNSVEPFIDCLVASRSDTIKYKRAKMLKVPVLTYPEFLQHFDIQVHPTDGPKDPFVDAPHPMVSTGWGSLL